jgi:glycosyltransferase involved in cell wall biosynthesis
MDVLVLPNQEMVSDVSGKEIGAWTSPLKMFEYMAHGKAILSSDLRVLKEVLEDEVNCLTCMPSSIDDWNAKLNSLVNNRGLRIRLGASAKQKFEQNYTWKHRAEEVLNIFEGVFNK